MFIKMIDKLSNKIYLKLILIYVCLICGSFFKFYFRIPNCYYGLILPFMVGAIFKGILLIFKNKDLNRIKQDINESEEVNYNEKIDELQNIDSKYEENIHFNIIKLVLVCVVSFLLGLFIQDVHYSDFLNIVCFSLVGFASSIYCMYTIYDTTDNNKKEYGLLLLFFVLACLAIIIKRFFKNILEIFNYIVLNTTDYLIFSLTIGLLCATLGLLALTYYMALNIKETTNNDKMLENGESFFISTIFSLFFLISIFGLSLIDISEIINLHFVNFCEIKNFILINTFLFLIIFSLISLIYTIKYLFKGIMSCLSELSFEY